MSWRRSNSGHRNGTKASVWFPCGSSPSRKRRLPRTSPPNGRRIPHRLSDTSRKRLPEDHRLSGYGSEGWRFPAWRQRKNALLISLCRVYPARELFSEKENHKHTGIPHQQAYRLHRLRQHGRCGCPRSVPRRWAGKCCAGQPHPARLKPWPKHLAAAPPPTMWSHRTAMNFPWRKAADDGRYAGRHRTHPGKAQRAFVLVTMLPG